MERSENRSADHIIDIGRRSDTSAPSPDSRHDEERASSTSGLPVSQSSLASSSGANSRNSSFIRRSEGYGRRRRSLLNSGLWFLIELVVVLSQIIASIIVLSLSRHWSPQAVVLFAWVAGYAFGCLASLPLLYWHFLHRNQGTEQDSTQARQDASQTNPPTEPSPLMAISVLQGTDEEDRQTAVTSTRNAQSMRISARLNVLVVYRFKRALHLFFVWWITIGNVWIFGLGWHSPSADAPYFYRFSILFLKICCVGFAWLYAAYATIFCCLLCSQVDRNHTRGAATETIIGLPTYKFKMSDRNGDDQDTNSEGLCCICLEKYADNDELRELPCAHFFHVDCVDKWLKKNGSCPLCKRDIGKTNGNLHTSAVNPNQPSAPE
ncbi:hypothetical protein MKW94_027406 [Papaver nudicaule]|uniref:RING-type domain-containing protein n=1 Tax=Papaver nudicaule TaxID=74823 RepID=A0AA41W1V7_PAPNU|nr:hypothetical protein [Papaver nudicaule]